MLNFLIPAASAAFQEPRYPLEAIIKKVSDLTQQIVVVVFIMAIIVFAWGIVKMISAAGNTEKLKQAKGIIWWGILGMFVLATIGGIIAFLRGELGIAAIDLIHPPQFTPK